MKKGLPSTLVITLLVVSTLPACVLGVPLVTLQMQATTTALADSVIPYPLPSTTVPPSPVVPYPIPSATELTYTPEPTWTPEPPKATPTVYSTPTSIPASQLEGEWNRYTKADGFCTDSPILFGSSHIGTGTTTLCIFHDGGWTSKVVPQGTIVTASWHVVAATDEGFCTSFYGDWKCEDYAENPGIRQMRGLGMTPVDMTADSVKVFKSVYRIAAIVGDANGLPTGMAVSGSFSREGYLPPEIWVGTNGYGVVVIQPETGEITRYTTEDGLPSNDIRDVSSPYCGSFCDFREVWVATDRGVAQWNGSQWKTYTTADGLPSNEIRGVASLLRNRAWVATAGGAAYFDGQDWRAFTLADGLPEGELTDVEWLHTGEVLFSTPNSGLVVFTITNQTQ